MKKLIMVLIAVILCINVISTGAYAKIKKPVFGSSLISTNYLSEDEKDVIKITVKNYKNCSVMRLTGKDRLVIDIPDTKVPDTKHNINVNSNFIKTIRIGQFNGNTCRIVADLTGQPDYEIKESKTGLNFIIKKPTYKNIEYSNNADRVTFILKGAELTKGGVDLTRFYTGEFDETKKKYIVRFPSNLADLGNGTFKINDSSFNNVKIENNRDLNETVLTINAKNALSYNIMTREFVGDTAITVLSPASNEEKLIVIDPGHGGKEPGAIANGLYEKDVNLDIAMRVNQLLKKRNIKTYIIREDDSYVDLFERTQIANGLNAALFLSIHNNAMEDRNFGGTMTLYYPAAPSYTKFSSYDFANIIQKNLLKYLHTLDRDVKERPNLVVLRDTKMTATLAEIAYLTNKTDSNNLKRESFKQKAATALADSVFEALKKLK